MTAFSSSRVFPSRRRLAAASGSRMAAVTGFASWVIMPHLLLLPVPCARSPAPGGAAAASGCRRHTAVGRFQRPAVPPGPYSAVASSPVTSVRALAASVARSQINGRRVSSSMAVHSQPVYCTVCPFLVIFTVKLLIV